MVARIIVEKCTGCGDCEDACPTEAITIDDVAVVDEDECTDCAACVDECSEEAIELDEDD